MNLLLQKMTRRPGLAFHQINIHWSAALLLLATCQASIFAQTSTDANSNVKGSVSATHVMGLEGVEKNAKGQLTVTADALKFQKNGGAAVDLKSSSIVSVFAGEEDKQVGGKSVALGRAATPFGGGRVVALFSHKKYDVLTLEYQDNDGGLHGAIFQLAKGQAQVIQDELSANGIHISKAQAKPNTENTSENK